MLVHADMYVCMSNQLNLLYTFLNNYVDATIKFNQSSYYVHEDSGSVQLGIVLSKPYSVGIYLRVNENSFSAYRSSKSFYNY